MSSAWQPLRTYTRADRPAESQNGTAERSSTSLVGSVFQTVLATLLSFSAVVRSRSPVTVRMAHSRS